MAISNNNSKSKKRKLKRYNTIGSIGVKNTSTDQIKKSKSQQIIDGNAKEITIQDQQHEITLKDNSFL